MPGGRWGALLMTMIVMFVLGFFLDFIEIVFVVVPLVAPPLILLGFDPVWLAILMALNLQTSFLTPPMAMSAYYLKGIAPPEVKLTQIFAGCMPFLFCVIVAMVLMYVFPQIVFYLPEAFYGS